MAPKPKTKSQKKGTSTSAGRKNDLSVEFKPIMGTPDRPAYLKGAAKKEWDRLTVLLDKAGLLAQTDAAAIGGYCYYYGFWVNETKKLEKEDAVISTKSGNLIQNPRLGIVNAMYKQILRVAIELGFTPASRGRVNIKLPDEQSDNPYKAGGL